MKFTEKDLNAQFFSSGADGEPLASRTCFGNDTYGGYWETIEERTRRCPTYPTSGVTGDLEELAEVCVSDQF